MAEPFKSNLDVKPQVSFDAIRDPFPVNESGIPEPAADRIAKLAMAGQANITQSDKEKFNKIKGDLILNGASVDLGDILAEDEAFYKNYQQEQTDLIVQDPFLTLEEKQNRILQQLEKPNLEPNLRLKFLRQFARDAEVQTPSEAETKRTLMDVYAEMQHYNAEFEKYKNENLHFDADSAALDFTTAVALPGTYAPQLVDVIRTALPEVSSGLGFLDYITPGELKQAAKEHLTTLSPKERFEAMTRLVDALDKNEYFGTDNGFIKWDLMNSLFDDYKDSEWEARLEDVFGIADFLAFGEFLRMGKHGVKRLKNGKVELELDGKKVQTTSDEIRRSLQLEYERVLGDWNKDSIAALVAQTDDKMLADTLRKAIEAKDEAGLRELGVDLTSATKTTMLPRAVDEPMPVAPNIDPVIASVDSFDIRNMAFPPEELDAADLGFKTRLGSLAEVSEVIHTNKSTFEATPYGYRGSVVIGPNGGDGYKSKKLAQAVIDRATTWFEGDPDIRLLARDYTDGEFKYIDEVPQENLGPINKRQYLVEVNANHVLTPADAGDADLLLDSGQHGRWAKWLDKSSYLPQWLVNATNQAEAQFNRRRINLNKMLKPLTSMVRNDQAKVMAVIEEGMRFKNEDGTIGKWFSDDELLERWAGDRKANQLLAGYRAFRTHQDEAWRLINDEVRRNLVGRGMKHVRIKGANPLKEDFIGQPMREIPGNVTSVYDAKLGKVRRVTEEDRKLIAESTGDDAPFFVKLSTPLEGKSSWNHYVLANDRNLVTVNRLPWNVVRQDPGQAARVYDAAYVLRRRIQTSIDGRPPENREVTVRIYNNKVDAEADMLRHLEEAGVDVNDAKAVEESGYKLTLSNELTNEMDYAARDNTRFLEQTGALFTSPRGTEKLSIDGSTILRPVGESIRAIQLKAARIGTLDLVAQKMHNNLNKAYGDLFVLDQNNNIPLLGPAQRNPNPSAKGVIADARWEKAIAARDYLKLIVGIDDYAVKSASNKAVVALSDIVANIAPYNKKAQWNAGVLSLRDKDPLSLPKMINFTRFMVLNPIRQAFLQSHQGTIYLGMEGGAKYWGSLKGFQEMAAMNVAAAFRDTKSWEKVRKHFANQMKITEEEYEQMFDQFRRSGLWDEIDSHQYVSGAVFNGDLLKADQSSWRNILGDSYDTTLNMFGFLRSIGFDFGENQQLLAGYLTMRNRWKVQNPNKKALVDSNESVKEIAGLTRQAALNMNRSGSLESQRNYLSLAAQFSSFGQKTLQLLLPTKSRFGAKGFISDREKVQVLLGQTLLFGTEATATSWIVNEILETNGWELPPDALMAMTQGIYGTLFNVGLRAATGEEIFDLSPEGLQTNVAISGGVAPTSAIFGGGYDTTLNSIFGRVFDTLVLGDRDIVSLFFGPTGQLLRDISGISEEAAYLFGINPKGIDIKLPENESKAWTVVDSFARKFIPLYNNDYARLRTELALGSLVDKYGEPNIEATPAEIIARNILGAEPTRAISLRELKRKYKPPMNKVDPLIQPNSAKLDDIASTLFAITTKVKNQQKLGKATNEEVVETIATNMEFWKYALPEHEFYYLNNRMGDIMRDHVNAKGTSFEVSELVAGTFAQGKNKGSLSEQITEISNMPEFEHKQELLDLLRSWRGDN